MKFVKYEGLGNDFIILEEKISKDEIVRLCNRNFGIGADGLIVFTMKNNIPYMDFYNADGSLASMCGNGIRCYADYLYRKGIDFSIIETLAGVKKVERIGKEYRVYMGKARVDFENLEYKDLILNSVYTGTEHCVVINSGKDLEYLKQNGLEIISNKDIFPIGTNLNLINILDKNNINMITYERGVGITLACGTGACASAYMANLKGLTDKKIKVKLLGGELFIEIEKEGIYMTGPANRVFEGEIL